jgi:hypothetical protein
VTVIVDERDHGLDRRRSSRTWAPPSQISARPA